MQLLGTVLGPLQCYASLLLIDAIHVWIEPRNRDSVTADGSRIAVGGKGGGKKSASRRLRASRATPDEASGAI